MPSDPTLERIDDRLKDLSTACSTMDGKLDKVRLEQSVQAERWIQHERRHDGIDHKIEGIETREREDATGRVDVHAHGAKPSRPPLVDAKRLREWFLLAAIVAAAVLSVWTSATTPTKADVTTAVEEQTAPLDRAAKSLESVITALEAAAEPVPVVAPAPVFPETVVTP